MSCIPGRHKILSKWKPHTAIFLEAHVTVDNVSQNTFTLFNYQKSVPNHASFKAMQTWWTLKTWIPHKRQHKSSAKFLCLIVQHTWQSLISCTCNAVSCETAAALAEGSAVCMKLGTSYSSHAGLSITDSLKRLCTWRKKKQPKLWCLSQVDDYATGYKLPACNQPSVCTR